MWRRALKWSLAAALAVLLGALAWAAFVPVHYPTRNELFEIPKGTWKRRMAGDKVEILPSEIHLALGVRNVLLLRNLDDVPQIFGPTLIMPGQSFSLPFDMAAENEFSCTAHASGSLKVIVEEEPNTPWRRLHWRIGNLWRDLEKDALLARAKFHHGS